MYGEVKRILSKFTEEEVTEESVLDMDLGLSSFDVVEIVCEFEDAFDIEIPDRVIQEFVTVGDVVAYLEKRM